MRDRQNPEAQSRARDFRRRCLGVFLLMAFATAVFHFGAATLTMMFLFSAIAGVTSAWDAIRPIPSDEALIAMFHERHLALTSLGQFHERHCIVSDKTLRTNRSIAPLLESAQIAEVQPLFSNRHHQSNRESGTETQGQSRAPCAVIGFEILRWVDFSVDHYSHSYGHLMKTLAYVPANLQEPPTLHVVDSLNTLPEKNIRRECLYRRVEGDWYIKVCPRDEPSFH